MYRYTYAILDTETTGFYFDKGDRIVEIAALKIRDGEIKEDEKFTTLINPGRSIPLSATRIHNIVDEMVSGAPCFADILDDLMHFLSDVDFLVMHNAKFDLGFLEAEARHANRELRLPRVVCSVELSKNLYPQFRYHNLNAIAKNFGLSVKEGEGRHRALGDVFLTGEALLKFYEENALTFIGTVEQLANNRYSS